MSHLTFHLGAHRTGTTFLQFTVAANRKIFAAAGWDVVDLARDQPDVADAARRLRRLGRSPDPADEETFQAYFAGLATSERPTFLSSEVMLGTVDLSGQPRPYAAATAMLTRLQSAVGSARVAFSVRDFGGFLESTYHILVYSGLSQPFEAYLADIDLAGLSWLPTLDAIAEAFGAENLVWWSFEDFVVDARAHVGGLIRHLTGVEVARFRKDKRNGSFRGVGLEAARLLNDVLSEEDAPLALEQKKWLRRRVRRRALALGGPKIRLLDKGLRAELSARYEEELAVLDARYGAQRFRQPRAAGEAASSTATDAPKPVEPMAPVPAKTLTPA